MAASAKQAWMQDSGSGSEAGDREGELIGRWQPGARLTRFGSSYFNLIFKPSNDSESQTP